MTIQRLVLDLVCIERSRGLCVATHSNKVDTPPGIFRLLLCDRLSGGEQIDNSLKIGLL